jgi:DNA-binding transcriptional MerR regulator
MNEQYVTHIILWPWRSSPSYSERETIAASHLGIGAIRHLRALGLIEGVETGGELRYSEEEVIQLRRVRRLQRDPGVNLAGVEVIIHLLSALRSSNMSWSKRETRRSGRVIHPNGRRPP